ncbi:MAG TPA: glycoside hydrolase family 76 protein [Fimbriimonadaceae bacterium]|nr:glycoside hydrolase family 76 protein [Fimbriimonadaceae bacterium]
MFAAILAMTILSTPEDWKRWGEECLESIRRDLYVPKKHLYREDGAGERLAYDWPSGVMLTALNAAARVDDRYKPWLRDFAEATRRCFWHAEGGYDSNPFPGKGKDRYYDDNAWMAIALMETYHVLGDRKYLDWARETVDFILAGEDDKLGGGIYWRENEKKSKNTCANAPAALACAKLSEWIHDPKYLTEAVRIYDWTRRTLRNPANDLYWDHVSLNGKVQKTMWSYNTALMIRAGRELAKLTKDLAYALQADASTKAAIAHWLNPEMGLIRDEMPFAHLLFEALIEQGYPSASLYLDGLHSEGRDSNGRYGHRWDEIPKQPLTRSRLIDQASAARSFLLAAAEATKR